MRDIVMDAFKLGLGTFDLSREQAERLVKKVESRYGKEMRDGRKMVNDILKQAKKHSQNVQKRVEIEVDSALKKQQLVHEQDLKELSDAFKQLAKAIANITRKRARTSPKKHATKRAKNLTKRSKHKR